jgi:hypothetical protein
MIKNEDARRLLTRALAWGAWLTAMALTALRLTGEVGQAQGVLIVFFIGIAIAAGSALSRMHLRDTIVGAFEAGLHAAEDRLLEGGDGHEEQIKESSKEILDQVRANRDALEELKQKLASGGEPPYQYTMTRSRGRTR